MENLNYFLKANQVALFFDWTTLPLDLDAHCFLNVELKNNCHRRTDSGDVHLNTKVEQKF